MADKTYDQVLSKIYNTPWLITQDSLEMIVSIVERKMQGGELTSEEMSAIRLRGEKRQELQIPESPSVAVLSINGPMFPKANMMTEMSGATSTNQLSADFTKLMNSDMVTGIVLNVDSPGGSVEGIKEFADMVYAARQTKKKPIYSVANFDACSAAYYIASQADKMYATDSARVGSIGVVSVHTEKSQADAKEGIKRTVLHVGEHKAEGNPYEPLGEEAKQHHLAMMGEIYDQFVSDVARGRNTDEQNVLDNYGKGRWYRTKSAMQRGMIDGVATLESVVGNLAEQTANSGNISATPVSLEMTPEDEAFIRANAIRAGEVMGAIAYHKTAVVDKPWDGPGAQAACKAASGPLHALHAWVDSSKDPNQKGSYKLPHHEVSGGTPGAANINGVRNALARLPQSTIPSGDYGGVRAHLNGHMRDFHGSSNNSTNGGKAMPELTPAALEALGLSEDATTEDIEFAVLATVETLKATPETTTIVQNVPAQVSSTIDPEFAEKYPEQAELIQKLLAKDKRNEAKMFAAGYERFESGSGFSALALGQIEDLHLKIADGMVTHKDLTDLLDSVASGSAVVDYREVGSTRGKETGAEFLAEGQDAAKQLSDMAFALAAEKGLSYGDALSKVMNDNPQLAEAYDNFRRGAPTRNGGES